MSQNINQDNFFDLQEIVAQKSELEKENLSLKLEVARLENQLDIERHIAQLDISVYSNVKRFFRRLLNV